MESSGRARPLSKRSLRRIRAETTNDDKSCAAEIMSSRQARSCPTGGLVAKAASAKNDGVASAASDDNGANNSKYIPTRRLADSPSRARSFPPTFPPAALSAWRRRPLFRRRGTLGRRSSRRVRFSSALPSCLPVAVHQGGRRG